MENLCQRRHSVLVYVTLGQRSSNGQNYAIVYPNLMYLWHCS